MKLIGAMYLFQVIWNHNYGKWCLVRDGEFNRVCLIIPFLVCAKVRF